MLKLELSYITITRIGSKRLCPRHQLSVDLLHINQLHFGGISGLMKNLSISRPD